MAHFVSPQHKKADVFSDEGRIVHDRCSDGDSPISQLIPGQKVSCVTEAEGEDEEADSDDPVEFPGRSVGTCVKYPDHVKKDGYHHPMGRPPMEVSQDLTIEDECQRLHIKIGSFNRRCIVEHKEDSGDGEDDEEEAGDPTEAKSIGESKTMPFYLGGKDMQKEIVVDEHGPFQIGIGYSGPEDRAPHH